MKKSFKIAGLGEVLWDVYDNVKYLGGAPANFAAHVCRTGSEGYIMSRVGNDPLGDQLKMELINMGLDVSALQSDITHPTGTVKVTLDDKGIPSFDCTRDVAFDFMKMENSWLELVPQLDAVLWGTLAQRNKESRHAIQQILHQADNAVKVFDINLRGWDDTIKETIRESLQLATIIKLNENELATLKSNLEQKHTSDISFLQSLLQKYEIELAAVTFGENGSLLVTNNTNKRHPGFKVKAIDTTGSGDAFAAGLVIQYLQGAGLDEMSDFSNRLGAFVATRKGAVPFWTYDDLKRLDS